MQSARHGERILSLDYSVWIGWFGSHSAWASSWIAARCPSLDLWVLPGRWCRVTASREAVIRTVTVIIGMVIALTFLFGFGNVLRLALRLGVPMYVAPLVAPAVVTCPCSAC